MRGLILAILVGLGLGVVIGLYIGWVQAPVQYIQSPMEQLSSGFKDEYTIMVATAFRQDGDVNAAIQRLKPLGVSNIPQFVRDMTERYISNSGSGREADIRMLVALSRALGYYTPPMQPFSLPTPTPAAGS